MLTCSILCCVILGVIIGVTTWAVNLHLYKTGCRDLMPGKSFYNEETNTAITFYEDYREIQGEFMKDELKADLDGLFIVDFTVNGEV